MKLIVVKFEISDEYTCEYRALKRKNSLAHVNAKMKEITSLTSKQHFYFSTLSGHKTSIHLFTSVEEINLNAKNCCNEATLNGILSR